MTRQLAPLLVLLVLLASACGSGHSTAPRATHGPVWTSPAEPSPPGSAGRWSRADERQLLRSYER